MRRSNESLDMYYNDIPRFSYFGEDRSHGQLYITENGEVVAYSGNRLMILNTEMGGHNSKYEVFRWYDANTGVRKKAYISKLLREKFGINRW